MPIPLRVRTASLLLVVVLGGGAPAAATAAQEPIELEYLTVEYVPEMAAVLRETVQLFEADNPDVHIRLTEVPFPSVFQTIDATLASGAPVMDVFSADAPLVPKYAAAGAILPLDDVVDADERTDFLPGSLEEATWDGRFYAIPQVSSSQGVYVNTTLFETAGVPLPPTDPAARLTWHELRELARKLTIRDGDITTQWGLVIEQADAPYQLYPLIQSLGGEVISPDGSTVAGYVDSPTSVEALTFYQALYCADRVSPQQTPPAGFAAGRVAMMLGGTWNASFFRSVDGLSWQLTPHPFFEVPVTPTGSFHVAVNANTEHPEEAAAFAAFLTSTERSIPVFERANEFPARRSVFEALPVRSTVHPNDVFVHEAATTAVARPRTAAYGAMDDVLRSAFSAIIACADVESTMAAAVERIDPLLTR